VSRERKDVGEPSVRLFAGTAAWCIGCAVLLAWPSPPDERPGEPAAAGSPAPDLVCEAGMVTVSTWDGCDYRSSARSAIAYGLSSRMQCVSDPVMIQRYDPCARRVPRE